MNNTILYKQGGLNIIGKPCNLSLVNNEIGNASHEMFFYETNMLDCTDEVASKKKRGKKNSELNVNNDIKKLLFQSEARSEFLEKVCKHLVQSKDYVGAFILLQYNNGKSKDLYSSGYGSNTNNIRNEIIKGVNLPCCNIAKKRNGSIAICDPLFTCRGCVACQKEALAAFSIELKYLDNTYGVLVVSVPKEYVYNQQEISCFSELSDEISFFLHLFEHYSKDSLIEMNKNLIKEQTNQIIALKEENKHLKKINNYSKDTDNCKTFFLENISHEINNPLNGILGFSQLLQSNELLPVELKEYANQINLCGNQLHSKFENFIDISKIESGMIHLHKSKCFLENFLTDLHDQFLNKIKNERDNSIKILYNPNESVKSVFTDQRMLYKALESILNNAINYTYSGKIEFGYSYPYANNMLLFYVKDTGIGIPKNRWKVIFEKFTQIEEGARKRFSGEGLGLAIAKGCIEKIGGRIWLESEVGKGTTFYFTIPCVNPETGN